ncbi:hypothetical protein [Thiolapillus brandeum]|uniref:Uncharacterized protein n=1 Tax=Thiolapillus brandeum TaxID=1076588 RepID=A0A7U6JI68_9GAMM|nr:hypothetical protein [Thiolapillus brandeum]BAO43930.1 hypothetical protein TBH_C1000 [Thiolapillus brandeum]
MDKALLENTLTRGISLGGRLLVDYLAWTQKAPMIFLWGFAVVVLLLMLFTAHQDTAADIVDSFLDILLNLPWVGDDIHAWLEASSGEYDQADLRRFIFLVWGILSLVLMLFGYLRTALFGPAREADFPRLHQRLWLALMLLGLGFVGVYWSASDQFSGSGWGWLGMLAVFLLVLYLVSLYGLAVNHLSRKLLDKGGFYPTPRS